jgi:hypothetical protein
LTEKGISISQLLDNEKFSKGDLIKSDKKSISETNNNKIEQFLNGVTILLRPLFVKRYIIRIKENYPDELILHFYTKEERDTFKEKIESTIEKYRENKKTQSVEQRVVEKEQIRIESNKLRESVESEINKLDKDGNGKVDILEGEEFNLLLKKHQKRIIEIDRNYVKQFVQVSNYLKIKNLNIQTFFDKIKTTDYSWRELTFDEKFHKVWGESKDKDECKKIMDDRDYQCSHMNEIVDLFKNQIHTYNLILLNSLNMITSLVKDDMITFYEIYESFDKLNMFNSNWENEVSQKLNNISDGITNLMFSVQEMGDSIVNELSNLTYVTEELNKSVTNQLEDIESSLNFNNLLNSVQTYQMYKVNKNTKSIDN